MNKYVKLALVVLGTILLIWIFGTIMAIVGVQVTQAGMMMAINSMGPIYLYKRIVSLWRIAYWLTGVIGFLSVYFLWYFAYLKKLFQTLKENQ